MICLLVQKKQEVADRLSFFIESTYGAEIHEAPSFQDALTLIQGLGKSIDLVILDGMEINRKIIESFLANFSEIPVLLCVESLQVAEVSSWGGTFCVIDRAQVVDQVVRAMDDLALSGLIEIPPSEQGQVRIRTRLLLSVAPLQGDVYIRLSNEKFVKLFRQGDVFDQEDLEKYTVKKGVEFLYIRKEQCVEFATKLGAQIAGLIAQKAVTIEKAGDLSVSVIEAVQELIANIGFTKDVQEVVKNQVALTVKAMGKDLLLSDVLLKLQGMEGKYIASHSTLCAHIASAIAVQLQWASETTFTKLTLASYLHDITLSNQDLAKVKTLTELEARKSEFTAEEIKAYKEHPIKAAEIVSRLKVVPPDVDTIIRQHQERPDGHGFPSGLDHKHIAPLASLFIVAHDLAQYYLEAQGDFNVEVFLQGIRDQYKSSYFRKILSCLEVLRKL